MKFLHLADLHLGKSLNAFSLIEDQKFILQEILSIVKDRKPDCVLIAGDVYDQRTPHTDEIKLFDGFLNEIKALDIPVCIISGNHDDVNRLSFGADLMTPSGIYFAKEYTGEPQVVTLEDKYGKINIYLLPFMTPARVKHCFPDLADEIDSYDSAFKLAVEKLNVDPAARNILVAHQFVTGAIKSGSEKINVGGLDNIGADAFAVFDYVALGHVHRPQNVGGTKKIRYCGTPMKYSVDEYKQHKSVTMVELKAKEELITQAVPLTPLRDLRRVEGTYEKLMLQESYAEFPKDSDGRLLDFYHIILKDEEDVPDVMLKLRSVYKNILQLEYHNQRTMFGGSLPETEVVAEKSKLELIQEFYAKQNNQEMGKEQQELVIKLLAELGE